MQPPEETRPRRQWQGCRRLMTTFVWSVPGWAWAPPTSVLGPGLSYRWASSCISFAHFCITLSTLHLLFGFVYFPLVFECVSCKTCFLQYKWNCVNSKGICVKRLFISPILDNNWRSNVVVSDRQQIPQA